MARSQVTSRAIAFPARPNEAASSRCSRSQPSARAISSGVGRDDEPGGAVRDDLERPAGVGRREDRFLGEERLERNHPVVLVDRRVVDGEATRVEIGELGFGHAAREARAPVQPAIARELLEPLSIRPVAGDDDLEARVARSRLEEEIDALRAVEAVDGEDEVSVPLAAVVELLRRMREHLRREPGRRLQPRRDVPRHREEPRRLAEGNPIELLHLAPQRAILWRRRRTGRAAFRRARTPGGTGARARRACRRGARGTTGTSSPRRGRSAARPPRRDRACARGTPASARAPRDTT